MRNKAELLELTRVVGFKLETEQDLIDFAMGRPLRPGVAPTPKPSPKLTDEQRARIAERRRDRIRN